MCRLWLGPVLWAVACGAEQAPEPGPQPSPGPLVHDVYVWQRKWTPAVTSAVDAASEDFRARVLLAVETDASGVVWTGLWSADGQPRVDPLPGWRTDAQGPGGAVALAVRWTDPSVALQEGTVQQVVHQVLARADAAGWTVSAVHIDADIPTARLADWAQVLAAVRAATPVELAVLTLVDHVDKPGWSMVTAAVDTVVLQVHSVPLPGVLRPVLFDPALASDAVERAVASSQSPVVVALPTHTLYDAHTGGAVRAEPAVVAEWLAALDRAPSLRPSGVVWFRLPVADDPNTWTPETVAGVRAGDAPTSRLHATLGPPPAAWGAAETTQAVHVEPTGPDHAWLVPLEVCVPAGRLAVAPMDPRYIDLPASSGCVRLEPRAPLLLAPGAPEPVALVLADEPPSLRPLDAPSAVPQ